MENETTIESAASPEQQAAAAKLGWIPPDRFHGDAENFVDADEYIKRGETVLPIVKKQLAETRGELERVRQESAQTRSALEAAQEAIKGIELRHSVATQKAVEQAKRETIEALAAASEAGDHKAVAQLTSQLVDLKEAEEEPPPVEKKEAKTELPAPRISTELKEWQAENEWFGKDKIKTSVAQGYAMELVEELRASKEKLSEGDFYVEVGKRTEKFFAEKETEPVEKIDKVGGANHRAGAQRGGGAKGTYEALPKDARDACDADSRRSVGPDKVYKTQAEYRKAWAIEYYRQEA